MKPKIGFSQNFLFFLGPRLRDAGGIEQAQSRVHALGQAEFFDELGTRADQSFEIGDAPGRQTAGEIPLDDLVLDDELPIHGRRQGTPALRPGSRQRNRYDSQLPSWFKVPDVEARPLAVTPAARTRRRNARRHSGWYLPLVLQYRTGLCCDSYVRKPLRRFTFHSSVPGHPATLFAFCSPFPG